MAHAHKGHLPLGEQVKRCFQCRHEGDWSHPAPQSAGIQQQRAGLLLLTQREQPRPVLLDVERG